MGEEHQTSHVLGAKGKNQAEPGTKIQWSTFNKATSNAAETRLSLVVEDQNQIETEGQRPEPS